MEERKSVHRSTFWPFVAKTAAILFLVAIFLDFVLPDFSQIKNKIAKNFQTEQAKLYILSFVQNPAALYKTSEVAERQGRLASAVRDMELAIGLLEMHNADKAVLKRYYSRLEELQTALKKKG